MTTVHWQCSCGTVAGASPQSVNRVVCYCDDCQAYAHHLGRADLLDAHGGTDIVQVAPASMTITKGHAQIAGVRLGPKGPYRWHTTCCKTPVGNTVGSHIPFVGLLALAFAHGRQHPDAVFGAPRGAILGRYAIGEVPAKSRGMPLRIVGRALRKVLGWKITGKTWPHPFFEREGGAPVYSVTVLSKEARDALRPLCGPKPQ